MNQDYTSSYRFQQMKLKQKSQRLDEEDESYLQVQEDEERESTDKFQEIKKKNDHYHFTPKLIHSQQTTNVTNSYTNKPWNNETKQNQDEYLKSSQKSISRLTLNLSDNKSLQSSNKRNNNDIKYISPNIKDKYQLTTQIDQFEQVPLQANGHEKTLTQEVSPSRNNHYRNATSHTKQNSVSLTSNTFFQQKQNPNKSQSRTTIQSSKMPNFSNHIDGNSQGVHRRTKTLQSSASSTTFDRTITSDFGLMLKMVKECNLRQSLQQQSTFANTSEASQKSKYNKHKKQKQKSTSYLKLPSQDNSNSKNRSSNVSKNDVKNIHQRQNSIGKLHDNFSIYLQQTSSDLDYSNGQNYYKNLTEMIETNVIKQVEKLIQEKKELKIKLNTQKQVQQKVNEGLNTSVGQLTITEKDMVQSLQKQHSLNKQMEDMQEQLDSLYEKGQQMDIENQWQLQQLQGKLNSKRKDIDILKVQQEQDKQAVLQHLNYQEQEREEREQKLQELQQDVNKLTDRCKQCIDRENQTLQHFKANEFQMSKIISIDNVDNMTYQQSQSKKHSRKSSLNQSSMTKYRKY